MYKSMADTDGARRQIQRVLRGWDGLVVAVAQALVVAGAALVRRDVQSRLAVAGKPADAFLDQIKTDR
jgi:hypothetical protein